MASKPKTCIIGIDLGTTNTVIGYFNQESTNANKFEIIQPPSDNKIPSFVLFNKEGVVVGKSAKDAFGGDQTKNIVYGVKRFLGRKINEPNVSTFLSTLTYKVRGDLENNPVIYIENGKEEETHKPEEIQAIILQEVAKIVKLKTLLTPTHVVITVPAYFTDVQKKATLKAAEIAGFPPVKLFSEPVAAALSYFKEESPKDGNILVYDFGGGTLDVTIINVKGHEFNELVVVGDAFLGGNDIDNLIIDRALEKFLSQHKDLSGSPKDSPLAMGNLRKACEETKIVLSTGKCLKYQIIINQFYNTENLNVEISQGEFTELMETFQDRLINPIQQAIDRAHLNTSDINTVILVGGSSNIPYVKSLIEDYFSETGLIPYCPVSPFESIALGAARASYYEFKKTSIKTRETSVDYIEVSDSDSESSDEAKGDYIVLVRNQVGSIGVASGRRFVKFIEHGERLPSNKTLIFTNGENSTSVSILVLQGESETIDMGKNSHTVLGNFVIGGFPAGRCGSIEIKITINADSEGILSINAIAINRSTRQVICDSCRVINQNETISASEIEAAKNNLKRWKLYDEKKDRFNDLKCSIMDKINKLRKACRRRKEKFPDIWNIRFQQIQDMTETSIEYMDSNIPELEKWDKEISDLIK